MPKIHTAMVPISSQPLLVELRLAQGRITGITRQVEERRRLIDLLTAGGEAFDLEEAQIWLGDALTREFATLSVEKRAILLAIPRETNDQTRQRAMQTRVIGRVQTMPTAINIIVAPYIVEGHAHLPTGIGGLRGRLHALPSTQT